MFGSSNNNNAKTNSALPKVAVDNFEAYIGKSTQITGNITAQGSIRIDGTFSGIVFSESDVVVGETGNITGNIKANIFGANVTVAGKIEGNIVAKGTLEVLASSVITGDVRCEKLTVETGAVLRGNVGGLEDAAAPQLEGAETK